MTWARALALAERYAGLFRVVPCAAGPGYHLALDCGDGVNRDSAGIGLPGVPGGDGGGSEAEIGERAWRGEFVCCADVRLASCCNPGTALTVGELRAAWTGVDDATPILVARNGRQADWAQAADVIAAEDGLVVARLFAPWAKQGRPAPGTVWAPATPINAASDATDEDRAGA